MRSPTPFRNAAVALLLAAAGCSTGPSAGPETPRDPAGMAASEAPSRSSAATTKTLAMAPSPGNAPVDREIALLQQGLDKGGPSVERYGMLGRAWIRKAREAADPGFYLNAKAAADLALELAPSSPLALNLVAMVHLSDHRFVEARDVAEQILAKLPDDLMALGTLSDAHLELGDIEAAERAAERMIDLKPNLPSYSRASYLAWLRGDDARALEAARLAIDSGRDGRDPEPGAWAVVQAANLWWHKGDLGGADAGYDMALARLHEYAPALVGKGRVALARGDGKRAVEYLERAYAQSPLVETAWLLGAARAASGDAAGADAAYALVVKDGRRTDGRTLAQFYAAKGRDADEALRLAEAEMKVRPGVHTLDAYAWALYRGGRFADARAASDKARAPGVHEAALLYHAGAIRIAQGEEKAGAELVKKALEQSPHFDAAGAAEARKLVE